MIRFDGNIFYVSGKRYTYAMYVNAAGYLQHAYYGKKVSFADIEYYVAQIGNRFEPKKGDINADSKFDTMPSEYGFYAHGDYREPSVIAVRSGGAAMSRLRYGKHAVYDGVPACKGLPHVRGGGQTLEITLKDDFSDTEIILTYTAFDDSDVLVRGAQIVNTGKAQTVLKKAFSFCVDLPYGDSLLRLYGDWAAERTPVVAPIERGVTRLQSLRGASSHQTSPFAAVISADCTEERGECYGVQLVYSGSFAITAEKTFGGAVRLQGGVNDTNFEWVLGAGESFTAPQALLCYSGDGLGELSREYADFLREHIINPQYAYKRRPIVVNNWEATYFDFDSDKICAIIDEAAELGIDTFVLDDGWFGARNSDKAGLGDWAVNEQKLLGGLQTLINRCKRNGMRFGLWFEPECVNEDSDLYRAHPDWAIGKTGVEPCRHRNQLVLDFTRKEVVDHIFATVSNILSAYEISYVKWDFNRSISEFYSQTLGSCQGAFAHKYMLGVYDLAQRLTAAFPDVFFEGCAGGGGRFDAGMLYYFPQIWTSDNTDAYERVRIQWGTSLCFPASSMSCHVSACPNHWTQRTTPLQARGAVASLGAFGYELDLTKLSDEEKETVREQIRQYKQTDTLVLRGDLYRLYSPFESDLFCEMLVSKDKSRAYAVGMCLRGDPYETRTVRLKGLDENKTYTVAELGLSASGTALMQIGLPLSAMGDYDAWQWHIEEVQ